MAISQIDPPLSSRSFDGSVMAACVAGFSKWS